MISQITMWKMKIAPVSVFGIVLIVRRVCAIKIH